MDLTPDTTVRELRRALDLPSSKCSYHACVERVAASSRKLDTLTERGAKAKQVELLYAAEEYKKYHITLEGKEGFPPRRVIVKTYMADGTLRKEVIERDSKTHLDESRINDLLCELSMEFDASVRKHGNRLPAWCA